MKKILGTIIIIASLFICLTGCSNDNLNYTSLEIVGKVYEGFGQDELPMLEKTDMKTMIENEMFSLENDLGIKELNYEEATVSQPMMGSIAHSVVVIKLKDTEDAATVAAEIKEKINPRKWVCVEAEQVYVENRGNTIIAVMADKKTADKIIENFRNLK
jgi:hypothetical protein